MTVVRDDDRAEASARLRRWIGAGLAVLAVVTLALPLASVGGVTTSALFSLGADISWAGWTMLVAVLLAVVIGATTTSGWIALGALVAAAADAVVYVVPPTGVGALPPVRNPVTRAGCVVTIQ